MMKKIGFIFYLLLLKAFTLQAQNKVLLDSINKAFKLATHDTTKFNLNYLAFKEQRLNAPDKALLAAQSCLNIANVLNDGNRISNAYSYIALSNYYLVKIDSSIFYANKSIDIAQINNNKECLSTNYTTLGNIANDKKDHKTSVEFYEKSLAIQKELRNDAAIGRDLNNIAGVYAANLDYATSLKYRLEGLRYVEKTKNKESLFISTINLQTTFRNLKQFDKAIEYGNKALALSKELNKKGYTIKTLRGQANMYFDLPNEEALKIGIQPGAQKKMAYQLLQQAVTVAKDFNNLAELSSVWNDLAYAYIQDNNNDSAAYYYTKCLKIDTELQDTYSICADKTALGEVLYKQGKYKEAELLCKEALETANKEKFIDYTQENNRILNLIYEKTGELEKALAHLKNYTIIKDSILNDSTKNAITKEIIKYDYDKKSIADSSLNEKEKAIINTKLEKENKSKWLFAILALTAIAIGAFLFRFYLKKKKTNAQLNEINDRINKQNSTLKILNTELIESEENLLNANSSKEQLISMMSHDLLNPITAISNYNQQILSKKTNNEDLLKALQTIDAAIQPVQGLLDNMLHWTTIQKDGIKANNKMQDVNAIIKEVISIYQPQAQLKYVKLNEQLNSSFNYAIDKQIISLIVRNLLNNAIKYSPNNTEICITTNFNDRSIIIEDQGFGMTNEMINYLNNNDFNKIEAKGSGVGLKLCFEFAKEIGAKIIFARNETTINNQLVRGTKVQIKL